MLLALIFMHDPIPGVIDRIEGGFAVIEWVDQSFSDLPTGLLPPGCEEGGKVEKVFVYKASIGCVHQMFWPFEHESMGFVVFAADGRSRCGVQ